MKTILALNLEELEALKRAINYALNYPYVSPADERQLGSARAKISEAIITAKNLHSNK